MNEWTDNSKRACLRKSFMTEMNVSIDELLGKGHILAVLLTFAPISHSSSHSHLIKFIVPISPLLLLIVFLLHFDLN
jgi:hypothetical protein